MSIPATIFSTSGVMDQAEREKAYGSEAFIINAFRHFHGPPGGSSCGISLRKALGILDLESNKVSLDRFPRRYLFIERTREAATIVMLVVLSLLAGQTWLEKSIIFLLTFAFWDLFYYVSLYLLIKWPPRLTTLDVLFLIPCPWIAPVWVPVGISTITILSIAILYLCEVV